MKLARSYRLAEFLFWTRRRLFILLPLALLPVMLYRLLGQTWIAAPWAVAAVLGTAASFTIGFKNSQTYSRTVEAQQIWTTIASTSRYWGLIARDFPTAGDQARGLIHRHLAWLTVLRHQLRGSARAWETANDGTHAEYQANRAIAVPEREIALGTELAAYLPETELALLAATQNKSGRLIELQSQALRDLLARQAIGASHHTEMQKTLKDLMDQQSRAVRIKEFPYPRQYAAINTLFVWCFVTLLPFCLLREFDGLNEGVTGLLHGHMVWLTAPFSILIGWIYLSLDLVGESTENPFEGGANDVPIAHIARAVEIELRELLGESDLPPPLTVKNEILM